jgi:hypothetical protein
VNLVRLGPTQERVHFVFHKRYILFITHLCLLLSSLMNPNNIFMFFHHHHHHLHHDHHWDWGLFRTFLPIIPHTATKRSFIKLLRLRLCLAVLDKKLGLKIASSFITFINNKRLFWRRICLLNFPMYTLALSEMFRSDKRKEEDETKKLSKLWTFHPHH